MAEMFVRFVIDKKIKILIRKMTKELFDGE